MNNLAKDNECRILMVYIEPTPYILALINSVTLEAKKKIDVLFLTENRSQKWSIYLNQQTMLFPSGLMDRIKFISKIFFTTQYNLIHIAGWGEPWCIFLIFLAKLLKIPVSVESDTPIPNFTKTWKRIVKRMFYPQIFKLINLFLPGGKRQAKYLEYYNVKEEKIVIAQMTVDVKNIQNKISMLSMRDRNAFRQKYKIDNNHVVFVFVGRLEEYKGLNRLITAFNKIKNKNIILLIIGDGSLRDHVTNISNNNANIIYVGRLIDDDLLQAYYAADVLILPSTSESWGLVINEAMAVGLPVIVSAAVGCVDDLIIHKETGLIVSTNSIIELQSAIEYMNEHPVQRLKMGMNAHNLISDWTLENEAKIICQAWSRLC